MATAAAPSIGFPWPGRGWREAIEARLDAERDQLPLWLPVAIGCGIAAWYALPERHQWTALMLASAGLGLVLWLAGGGRAGRAGGIFLLALALGCGLVWWRAERVAAPVLARPTVARFTGRIEAVEPQPARGLTRLRLATDGAGGVPARVRVNLEDAKRVPGLLPGTRIAVRARLVPPAPASVPGAYDFARVAWFAGIGATGRALDPPMIVGRGAAPGWWERLGELRRRISVHIQERLAGSAGGIAASFATGDTGAISDADADAMRRSGLAHLLSISGLHVSAAVAAAMLISMRLLALSPRLALTGRLPLAAAAVGAVAGIGYTLLAGAEVPTVRSCIAALLVIAGIALGREAMTLRLVATGALVVMLAWPEAVVGPSFQLSFAAVTAIVALHDAPAVRSWFAKREEGAVARWSRELAALFLTGVLIELVLAPIALFHFHRAGLYGAAANIVAIPLTTFVVMPAEALALLLDTVGIGAPAWWVAGLGLRLLLWIAHLAADAPGAVAALPSMPAGAFALMVAGLLWLALWRTGWRAWGAVPLVLGAAWALATPTPDILVTGDGRHVAVRGADGSLALLRPRAGDYVRELFGTASGIDAEPLDLAALSEAACTADLCRATLARGGRRWRLLATRSPYLVDFDEMVRACAAADIVVSDRRLPRGCAPRWLRADAPFLARTGGLAIALRGPRVSTVAAAADDHPWMKAIRSGATSPTKISGRGLAHSARRGAWHRETPRKSPASGSAQGTWGR